MQLQKHAGPNSPSLTQCACTYEHVLSFLVRRLNKRKKKLRKTLVVFLWCSLTEATVPSEDRGLTLIPWRLIGADKAARTRSSFTDNWVAQLNYFGARREAPSGRTRRGVTRVPFCIFMYLSVAVPQVRAIIRKEKKKLSQSGKRRNHRQKSNSHIF